MRLAETAIVRRGLDGRRRFGGLAERLDGNPRRRGDVLGLRGGVAAVSPRACVAST